MFVKRIKLTNYRNYRQDEIILQDFNVIVGPNASGKSNLISSLKFLRDSSMYGFSDAVSLQGGFDLMKCHESDESVIKLEYEFEGSNLSILNSLSNLSTKGNNNLRLALSSLIYRIDIHDNDGNLHFFQSASLNYSFLEYTGSSVKTIGAGRFTVNCDDKGTISPKHRKLDQKITSKYGINTRNIERHFSPYFAMDKEFREQFFAKSWDTPIIDRSTYILSLVSLDSFSFFDFDPKLAKLSSKFAGKKELEEDGSNFNVALKYVFADTNKKEKFVNQLKDFLPFIKNLKVEQSVLDKALLSVFSESGGSRFPSFAMSDGSMYIACLILGISFSNQSMVVIEEPEKYVHPGLALKIVDYLQLNSDKKQIIVTSHSPQIVKSAGIDNVLVVSRSLEGSHIMAAKSIPHINDFIENEVGLDQLFSNNLLVF